MGASPLSGRRLFQVREFLRDLGLDWDNDNAFTVCVLEGERIIATGSRCRNVLKCIGTAPGREGEGLTAAVVTELVKNALREGYPHLFLYTTPGSAEKFGGLGFHPVAAAAGAVLMENRRGGVGAFVDSLEYPACRGVIGAVVANCNPFTNGHRYLVETAASGCDLVHLFILSEDRSAFSAEARMMLARKGVADLANVVVHPTGDYLISSATFPDYFLKDKAQTGAVHCELDLTIFAERFAKPLGITRRYVGSEPFDRLTAAYNRQMHAMLPPLGVEVIEIPRLERDGRAVSASAVRDLLAKGHLEELLPLVPPTTYTYLESLQ